jgi:MipA family protein
MRLLVGAVCVSFLAVTGAFAQTETANNNWNLTLGLGGRVAPLFLGSKEFAIRPRPVFGLSRGLRSRWHSAEDDAIGPGLIFGESWRMGFSGALLWERRESSNRALRGLGNVDFGFEAGAFAEYYPLPWLRARADLRRGFLAHEAVRGELKLDAFGSITPQLSYGLGPRVVFATAPFNRTYFGVNATQALASGLPFYRPKGGVESVGFLTQATYAWTPRLRTTVSAEYRNLVGDAGHSPLVRQRGSRNQFTFGLSTSYTFDLGR